MKKQPLMLLIGGVWAILALALAPATVLAQDGPPSSIGLQMVAEGLTAPIDLEQPTDNSDRMFIADQTGVIYVMGADGQLLDTPFLDISDQLVDQMEQFDERGLLGLALHPGFADNGRFYVYYSAPLRAEAPSEWNHTSHLSEFTVSAEDPNQADPASERVLLMVDQPQFNHDAGDITFGPDGYLYVPLGDGGAANDDALGHTEDIGNAQDLTKLLGKILRIDVDGGAPYGIPSDNPFVDEADVPDEIWAYGFRNPWRISFDESYGLIVADLGQNVWEEVHIVEAGQNYGWNIMEGTHCFSVETPDHNPLDCERTGVRGEPLQLPIIEYSHQVGISIIGGYVYRGEAMPSGLQGNYVFADWSTSFGTPEAQLLVATPPPDNPTGKMWKMQTFDIANTGTDSLDMYILSLGVDQAGELYVLTSESAGPTGDTGKVWRIVPAESVSG